MIICSMIIRRMIKAHDFPFTSKPVGARGLLDPYQEAGQIESEQPPCGETPMGFVAPLSAGDGLRAVGSHGRGHGGGVFARVFTRWWGRRSMSTRFRARNRAGPRGAGRVVREDSHPIPSRRAYRGESHRDGSADGAGHLGRFPKYEPHRSRLRRFRPWLFRSPSSRGLPDRGSVVGCRTDAHRELTWFQT